MVAGIKKLSTGNVDSWRSFVVAACSGILETVVFGISNSFPIFLSSMAGDALLGRPTFKELSVVSGVSTGLAPLLAVAAGATVHKFGARTSCYVSTAATLVSLILGSQASRSAGQLVFFYGFFMSAAIAFMFSTGATATATWFEQRKSMGMGICFAGSGAASLIIPSVAGALASRMDWRSSFLYLAFFCIASGIASTFVCVRDLEEQEVVQAPEAGTSACAVEVDETVVKVAHADGENDGSAVPGEAQPGGVEEKPLPAAEARTIHNTKCTMKELFTNVFFTREYLGLFIGYVAFSFSFYASLFIVVPFPLTMGKAGTKYAGDAPISVGMASMLFIPFGAAQLVASPSLGSIANVTVDKYVYVAALLLLTICGCAWAACNVYWEFVLIMIFSGIGVSGFFATYASMIAKRFFGPNLPVAMGVQFASAAIGGFCGPPAMAAMISAASKEDHLPALMVVGAVYFVSCLAVFLMVRRDAVPMTAVIGGLPASGAQM